MSVEIVDEVQDPEREDEVIQPTGSIIWNYFKIDGVLSKRSGAKNVTCIFCDTVFVGCCSSRAFAHNFGIPVLDQKKSNFVYQCVKMMIKGYTKFKTAQKVLKKEMGSTADSQKQSNLF